MHFRCWRLPGAKTLTDLKADSFKAVGAIVRALKDLDKETRDALLKFMSILFRSNLRMTLEGLQEETEKTLRGRIQPNSRQGKTEQKPAPVLQREPGRLCLREVKIPVSDRKPGSMM